MKFMPYTVTENPPDGGAFGGCRLETVGASKVKTDGSVPTRLDIDTPKLLARYLDDVVVGSAQ